MFDPVIGGLQLGAADYLKGNLALPWPKRESTLVQHGTSRVVRYCYVNDQARSALHCRVMGAMTAWSRSLGFNREQSGHSLGWREANDGNHNVVERKTLRCYSANYKNTLNTGTWNPAVEPDTLAIHLIDGGDGSSSATIGYKPKEWMGGIDDTGRHFMHIHTDADVGTVVHEFGHVLGMEHEQCRNDRDDYIEYHCDRVIGFEDALRRAIADGVTEDQARKNLCEDAWFAEKYKFMGGHFNKNGFYKNIPMVLDEPSGFDFGSVMLYDSSAFAPALCSLYTDYCTLLKIDKVDGKKVGVSRFMRNEVPSAGDVAFVKKYYPWESAAVTPGSSVSNVARNILNVHKFEL